ncbi:MAG: hypothetical protein QNJ98_15930 [Planctomycetota bacterium]|nr:hypothetical protein [Planctomycetota bacterium]
MLRLTFLLAALGACLLLSAPFGFAEDLGAWPADYRVTADGETIRRPSSTFTSLRRPSTPLVATMNDQPVAPTPLVGMDAEAPAAAAPSLTVAPRKRWSLTLEAYVWAQNIDGTSYLDGEEADLDISFADIFDVLEYGFMAYAELRYDRWSFAIDGSIADIADDLQSSSGITGLDFELTQTTIDLSIGYCVLQRYVGNERWGSCCYQRCMTLDAVIGARYWESDLELDVSVAGTGIVREKGTNDWWDPYVGLRWRHPFAPRWTLTLYGDIGGFGIEDGSELTWKLQGTVRYHINRSLFVALGYRALDTDRVEGSGPTQNGTDSIYHGPLLGIGFTF